MPNMMKLNDAGLYEEAPYDLSLLSFEFEGTCIQNPYLSQCSRFDADPKDYGFQEAHTGGGCMALILRLPDGGSLWLTDDDGMRLPEPGDWKHILLGRFDADGQQLAYITVADIPTE
jgi:hypothetical protein